MGLFKFRDNKELDIPIVSLNIENEDTFHLKNLYKLVHDWFDSEGYRTIYDSDDNCEVMYLERVAANGGKEHRIWWRFLKVPQNSNYYRYYFKIDWMTINMKDTEVMHQGYKMKTQKGDCIIDIRAYLQLDYNNTWEKNDFLKGKLHKWFRQRLYKEQIEAYKVDVYKQAYKLQSVIKQYLKLKTLYEVPKPFHPEKGL